ncbi:MULTISPECIES: GTP-binding protein [unclassified Streptomyces]|uniref:CobW family GTP-binding protein n=1 Tax=unclassified Streptomyces TaxID=2593676 RepID=UPI002DDA169A|nr:GTP-binding protein [Streptomyces sp. NBC_01795]WSA91953.1 GTP-binding protein [Streptomyces sp. NBC_01795]WSS44247.1 GTP-binding protein [Streptomyces sp. NBC_01187]
MDSAAGSGRGAVGGRIPVIILAGFLGSGKTTLLNHLLRRSRGTRIGAIVNDFGSIEIDAMAVSGQVDSMVSLGDGCLCCAVDTSDMDEVLDVLARPSAGMDVLVIEASGVAEPETLIRMILASESPHIVYGGLVEVVDAAEFEAVRERHPELDRHVSAADLLVLNKADRVDEEAQRALRGELERLSPGTPVVPARHGRVDPALLFDRVRRERAAVEQLSFDSLLYGDEDEEEGGEVPGGAHGVGEDHSGHLHAAYEAVEFRSDTPLDPRRFLAFLDSRPAGLYRMKGFVDFGAADPAHRYALHAVGGFLRFAPEPWPRGEARETQLVMIGSSIDAAALCKGLDACVGHPGEGDPRAMWGILRYVDAEADDDPSDPGNLGGAAESGDLSDLDDLSDPEDLSGPGDLSDPGEQPDGLGEPAPH